MCYNLIFLIGLNGAFKTPLPAVERALVRDPPTEAEILKFPRNSKTLEAACRNEQIIEERRKFMILLENTASIATQMSIDVATDRSQLNCFTSLTSAGDTVQTDRQRSELPLIFSFLNLTFPSWNSGDNQHHEMATGRSFRPCKDRAAVVTASRRLRFPWIPFDNHQAFSLERSQ